MYIAIYYKELAYVITEDSESKICSMGWQAWDPEEPMMQMKSERSLLENSLLLHEADLFFLGMPSTD